MNKRFVYYAVGLVVIVAIVLGVFLCTSIGECISLEWVKMHSASLKESVDNNYPLAVCLYCLIYASIISFGIPGVAPLTILGGYLFGLFGILYALIGATLGCLGGFFIMRYVFGRTIRRRYAHQLERFQRLMKRYGASYLLMIHYSTVVPFFIVNTLAALADVPIFTFVWTTIVGSIPLLSIYVLAGRQLAKLTSLKDIFSPAVIVVFILLAILAVVPVLIKRSKKMQDVELE